MTLPILDLSDVRRIADAALPANAELVRTLDRACREKGCFYVVGHGIDPALIDELDAAAREFFALTEPTKEKIAMRRGGRAWRGWFPVGAEMTAGQADHKEGLYFGVDLAADDPRVCDGLPLHGANLYPDEPRSLGGLVHRYIEAAVDVGQRLLGLMAVGLELDATWFCDNWTADPTVLFRVFRYPAVEQPGEWGVAEHTDYGLLTLLLQDATGGLEVRTDDGWVDVAPLHNSVVCNLGDMIEAMTGGRYRSTPHRVRATRAGARISCPLFLDPGWEVTVRPLPSTEGSAVSATGAPRWDDLDPLAWSGTYGDYLLAKVSRVFPDLFADVI